MILADFEIKQLCTNWTGDKGPMITPYISQQVKVKTDGSGTKVISYGQSSYGYDIRLDRKYKIFTDVSCKIIDPKDFREDVFVNHEGDFCLIPPHSFVLCSSMETFDMPPDVTAICLAKSTYARTGLVVGITPIESSWRGIITIELSNTTPLPLKVYSGEGIAQLLFFRGVPCDISYADRKGKYQDQVGITLPKV